MPETPTELPKGFQIESDESEIETISYKTTGMGCLLWFLVILLLGIGGCFALVGYLEPAGMLKVFNSWDAWFGFGCGFAAMIYCTFFLTFHLFGSTVFVLHPTKLTICKRLFATSWAKSVDCDKMEYFEQIQEGDGSEAPYPFWCPFWGLSLMAGRRFELLVSQPMEKSDWLGRKLANFFGVPFKPYSSRGIGNPYDEIEVGSWSQSN